MSLETPALLGWILVLAGSTRGETWKREDGKAFNAGALDYMI